eukprot:3476704-Rhodomonas_salina.2
MALPALNAASEALHETRSRTPPPLSLSLSLSLLLFPSPRLLSESQLSFSSPSPSLCSPFSVSSLLFSSSPSRSLLLFLLRSPSSLSPLLSPLLSLLLAILFSSSSSSHLLPLPPSLLLTSPLTPPAPPQGWRASWTRREWRCSGRRWG